jgi:hypothetical protein
MAEKDEDNRTAIGHQQKKRRKNMFLLSFNSFDECLDVSCMQIRMEHARLLR